MLKRFSDNTKAHENWSVSTFSLKRLVHIEKFLFYLIPPKIPSIRQNVEKETTTTTAFIRIAHYIIDSGLSMELT